MLTMMDHTEWVCSVCDRHAVSDKENNLPSGWYYINKQIQGFHDATFCSAECYRNRVKEIVSEYDKRSAGARV